MMFVYCFLGWYSMPLICKYSKYMFVMRVIYFQKARLEYKMFFCTSVMCAGS